MDFAPYQDTSPDTNRALSPSPPPSSTRVRPAYDPTHRSKSYTCYGPAPAPTCPPPSPPAAPHKTPGPYIMAHSAPPTLSQHPSSRYNNAQTQTMLLPGGYTYLGNMARRREDLDDFTTSLGVRMDWEAGAAYGVLPPLGAVVLLCLERKSDFVRFHAYQSALLFSPLFTLQLLFAYMFFSFWPMICLDLGLVGYLMCRAWKDAVTLDRFEVPFFGPLAARYVDDET